MADAPVPPQPSSNEVPPAGTPGIAGLMTLLVSVIALGALYVGRDVFIPVVLAVLLSFVLSPFVDLLRRWYLGRIPAVIVAVVTALAIILALGATIGTQVAALATDLPRYQETIRGKVAALRAGTIGHLPELMQSIGRNIQDAAGEARPEAAPSAPRAEEPTPLPVEVRQQALTPLELARNVLAAAAEPLATTGIVFVVLIFILMQREDLRDRMIRLFGSSDLHRTTVAMDDAARRLSRYFLIQLGLNTGFGIFIGIGLWLIGVPSPILWGIFAALMRFVPYVGSIVSAAAPALLAAAVDPGWSMALMTLALFLVSEPLMGHGIEPIVYGQSTGLSPFAVVLSAIFWTWLWGPIGLLLATPLTLCLVVLGRHVERLEFLDVLLGDRPALTPAENLYQRMLAGDPDEAIEYAEQLLKDRSLATYYDEVAVKGLQLAANDSARGVLTARQLDAIRSAVRALTEDLATHDDSEPQPGATQDEPVAAPRDEESIPKQPSLSDAMPAPETLPARWRRPGAVLCVAGRGPLDEAASSMLAQLVEKHGLGARVARHETVSRSAIASLDVTDVAMVCICYLEISGTPAHLRYLIRRLRRRLPNAPILVGLWPADDTILTDKALRSAVGAEFYVTSLRQAVLSCLEAAQRDGSEGTARRSEPQVAPAAAVPALARHLSPVRP